MQMQKDKRQTHRSMHKRAQIQSLSVSAPSNPAGNPASSFPEVAITTLFSPSSEQDPDLEDNGLMADKSYFR